MNLDPFLQMVQKLLLSIDGQAVLIANDNNNTFLGLVSSNQNHPDSICNPNGQYGSLHGQYSIRNTMNMYSGYSPYSLSGPYPVIIYNNQVIAFLSKNNYVMVFFFNGQSYTPINSSNFMIMGGMYNAVPVIDPDFMFLVYGINTYPQQSSPTYINQNYGGGGSVNYSQNVQQEPDYKLYYELGLQAEENQEYKAAVTAFQVSIRFKPDFADAWLRIGFILLYKLQKYQEAIEAFEQVIALNSNYSLAWLNKGIALENMQKYQEALASFDQAISINNDWGGVSIGYGWLKRGAILVNLKEYEKSLAALDRAIQLKYNELDLWWLKGVAYLELKRYEEALNCFDFLYEQKPEFADGWFYKIVALEELKRYDEGLACAEKALKYHPNDSSILTNKAGFMLKLNRHQEGLKLLDEILQNDANNAFALYLKAGYYASQSDLDNAIKNLQTAINIQPTFKESAKNNTKFDLIRDYEIFKQLIND